MAGLRRLACTIKSAAGELAQPAIAEHAHHRGLLSIARSRIARRGRARRSAAASSTLWPRRLASDATPPAQPAWRRQAAQAPAAEGRRARRASAGRRRSARWSTRCRRRAGLRVRTHPPPRLGGVAPPTSRRPGPAKISSWRRTAARRRPRSCARSPTSCASITTRSPLSGAVDQAEREIREVDAAEKLRLAPPDPVRGRWRSSTSRRRSVARPPSNRRGARCGSTTRGASAVQAALVQLVRNAVAGIDRPPSASRRQNRRPAGSPSRWCRAGNRITFVTTATTGAAWSGGPARSPAPWSAAGGRRLASQRARHGCCSRRHHHLQGGHRTRRSRHRPRPRAGPP